MTPGSPADDSGLQPGDVLLRIGRHTVAPAPDGAAQIHAAENDSRKVLPLRVMRDGSTAYLALRLAPDTG